MYIKAISLTFYRPLGSNKAMKLGSKGKDIDHFVDKLISEGTGEAVLLVFLEVS